MKITFKTIIAAILFACHLACDKPEEGLAPQKSVNADIVRFRIYQNQNIYFDGQIEDEESIINITLPQGIDKTNIHPQVLVSFGATLSPPSGARQDFTAPLTYTVTSQSNTATRTYQVFLNNQ
ncbi:MAG: hypothetical protein LBD80_07615 [Tannerella sp.]|jgi:hypothetical protein|nr:hypothetical protein [Tannerella sp.]